MGGRSRTRHVWRFAVVVTLGLTAAAGGVAWSVIPNGNVVNACRNNQTGALSVVDAGAGQQCPSGTTALILKNFNWRGMWANAAQYRTYDVVRFLGSSYIAITTPPIGNPPTDTAKWNVLAASGLPGVAGAAGAVGAIGPQGLPGVPGEVGPVGPQGLPGVAGAAGAVGATGPQGLPGVPGEVGPVGPQGPQGLQGLTGPQGPAGVIGPIGPAGSTAGGLIGGSASNYNVTGTALRYMGMFSSDFSATQADEQTTMPAGATLANLQVRVQNAAGIALQGWTITVEKNGVATALTCTLLGSATTCSNTVGSVPFASGDKLDISILGIGLTTGSPGFVHWAASYQ